MEDQKLPVVKDLVGDNTINVLKDTGCEGIVVGRRLVEDGQLTGKCCLIVRIDNTVLLAEKARIHVKTCYLSGDVEGLCIPEAVGDLVVGNVPGTRNPDDPDMSVMVGAATTRAQARQDAVRKLLRVPDALKHMGVDRAELIQLQQEDYTIRKMEEAMTSTVRAGKTSSFEMKNRIVYRVYHDMARVGATTPQVVLPVSLRKYVMSIAHDTITGGHLGIKKTREKITSKFYWPGADDDVVRYCHSCDVCQKTVSKGTIQKVPLQSVPVVDVPFKQVAVDLIRPIDPPSEAGHRYILTLVNYATRYPEAVPLKRIDAETVAEALVDIYSRLGIPEEVLSDQGAQFISDCMKEVCKLLGVSQSTTTPYHPMCNGLVEKFNGTLKKMLRRLCSEQPKQWHRYINALLFAYREVPQDSTHFAPFELMYGRTVRGPMHILLELWTKDIDEHEVKSSYQYVLDLRERLEDTLKLAQEQLKLSQAKQKCYYDKRTKVRRFQPGDKVLVLLPTDTNKLLLQWKGPYDVTRVVGPNDYKVLMKGKEKTLHANLLKKYVVREDSLIGNVVPAVQDDHRQNIPSGVAVVEDYEPDATVQGTDDPSADVLSTEDLPKIGVGANLRNDLTIH